MVDLDQSLSLAEGLTLAVGPRQTTAGARSVLAPRAPDSSCAKGLGIGVPAVRWEQTTGEGNGSGCKRGSQDYA